MRIPGSRTRRSHSQSRFLRSQFQCARFCKLSSGGIRSIVCPPLARHWAFQNMEVPLKNRASFAAFLVLSTFISTAHAQQLVGHISLGNHQKTRNEIFPAANSSTAKIYVNDSVNPGEVIVVDGATRTVLTTIAVDANGSQNVVNPVTNTIYAFNSQ